MKRTALLPVVGLLLVSCEPAQQKGAKRPAPATEARAAEAELPPPLQASAWLNSEPLILAELKGKVVVLDFWSMYCGPCRKIMPHLSELYRKQKAEGLVVIGVTEDVKAELEGFLKENPVAYPLAVDRIVNGEGMTTNAYGIQAIPTAWLIGRDGKVAWKGHGDKLTDEMVLAELAKK
jgi:thiol-disulfide isomerase/thioredoxin